MEQYIPKSAVVEVIEKRKNICKKVVWDLRTKENKDYYQGKAEAYKDVLDLLDTLEVKEMDLDKELSEVWRDWANEYDISFVSYKKIAKHFFELGLKTQHSSINIPNIDDIFEENGIDHNSKDAKIFKECYYMALEKLKAQKGE